MAQAKAHSNSSTGTSPQKRAPKTLAGVVAPQDGGRTEVIANYEAALALLQQGKYDKAHEAFKRMLAAGPGNMADRIRVYISACSGQIKTKLMSFSNTEEQFDYAASLLNVGQYDDAREQLDDILMQKPAADYAFYGLAVLASMTGDPNGCLEHLTRAINYNPRNRIQARSDSDFQDMADDPRFTELLYPEV